MKISVIGTGYVGLVTGACLAEVGNHVMCMDVDEKKIHTLRTGGIPIHEPGLIEIIHKCVAAGRLSFTTNPEESAKFGLVQFIAVGTPPDEDGSADLQYVLAAARGIAQHIDEYKIIVNKSTVPVGTADKVREAVTQELQTRQVDIPFAVVSNPEFLKEGAAVDDFLRPDRIVVGVDDSKAVDIMRSLYAPFQRNHSRLVIMDIRSAELTKYAANAMLATRISFMNELALLAEKLGADIEQVRHGIGSDPRIGYHFLYAGCGYGGSCFPKDVQALQRTAKEIGQPLKILAAVEDANDTQKHVLGQRIKARFGENLTGRRFALWGLAFKPQTDDMREATSRVVINDLLQAGATIAAYDPVAITEAQRIFANVQGVTFAEDMMSACQDADALIIVTEWKEFRALDFDNLKSKLKQPVIFDGRNLYEPARVREMGIEYFSIGRK